jgi:hypothetical protein
MPENSEQTDNYFDRKNDALARHLAAGNRS